MAVLDTLYRSLKISSYEDNYGGNVFDNYYYGYILFQNNLIYIFSSCPMYSSSKLKPINSFDDSKTIKNINMILKNASHSGYKRSSEKEIIFSLPVQVLKHDGEVIEVNRIFTVVFEKAQSRLKLKAFDENNPDNLVIDAEFERITLKVV